MSFIERPKGTTLRRLQKAPEPEGARFDPDFPVAMRCQDCGRVGYGPRKDLQDAVREHRKQCPARNKAEQSGETRLWYPGVE